MTTHLSQADLEKVCDTAILALPDPMLRPLLFEGVLPGFFFGLPQYPAPAIQLRSDLMRLNAVERLVDGKVPLEIWLYNATKLTSEQGPLEVLRSALDRVTASSGQADVGSAANPAELPEAVIFRDDTVPISFLADGAAAGTAVGRVVVRPYENGEPKLDAVGSAEPPLGGTGWLITPTLFMTNHHVLAARTTTPTPAVSDSDLDLQASTMVVSFDYDLDPPPGQQLACTDVTASGAVAWDAALDYAIVRIPPAGQRRPLPVLATTVRATDEDNIPVNVIQHPAGKAKRIGLRNNIIYRTTDKELRYFTDTEGGSSGSPVLTDRWKVCGLHRASARVNVKFQGKTTAYVNVGTQMSAILADLSVRYPAVHREVVAR